MTWRLTTTERVVVVAVLALAARPADAQPDNTVSADAPPTAPETTEDAEGETIEIEERAPPGAHAELSREGSWHLARSSP